jgi:hypothetical protein
MNKRKKLVIKLVIGTMVISMLPITGLSLLFHDSTLSVQKVKAATSLSEQLVPGGNYDTGNHSFDGSFQKNPVNWTVIAGDNSWWKWDPSGNNYFWLANEKKSSWVYHKINAAIDFSQNVTIKTPYYLRADGLVSSSFSYQRDYDMGDAAGFILTPENEATIRTNAPGATGEGMGLKGLKNSLFIGRDLYQNKGVDGSSSDGPQDQIEIRKTDASGAMETSTDDNKVLWPQKKSGYGFRGGGGLLTGYWHYLDEIQTLSWIVTSNNEDGTYTGVLNLYVTPYNNTQGNPLSLSRTVTLPRNINLTSVGITGGNTGQIQEGNASSLSDLQASRAVEEVTVNYIDSRTNQPITNVASSTIKANVGEIIGASNGSANSGDTYTYGAPSFAGYDLQNAASITVDIASDNSLNIYYTPKEQEEHATFKTYYALGTPGTGAVKDDITELVGGDPNSVIAETLGLAPALPIPTPSIVNGLFGENIGTIPTLDIPAGYQLKHVVGPDGQGGKTYPDIAAAIAGNPTFDDIVYNSWANYFSIYLSAKSSTATFTYKYVDGTGTSAPALPSIPSQTGVTGGVIDNPSVSLPTLPSGVTIQSVTSPDGKIYETLSEAYQAGNNKYYLPDHSDFIIQVALPGTVSLDHAPDVSFGTKKLSGGQPSYETVPDDSLQVTDDTGSNKGWSVTAELTQQFTSDVNASEATAPLGTFLTGATLDFTSLRPSTDVENEAPSPTSYSFSLKENQGAIPVINAPLGTGAGQWFVDFSKVTLNTNGAAIATDQPYRATIKWSLNDVPM